jgi:hypothetical protein
MSNLNDIFSAVPTIEQPTQNFKVDEFNPSAKSSKTGTYTAIVRFVPWHVDPTKSIMSKQESFLTDPASRQSRTVDSLKNFQQSCPIVDTFWALHNSGDASLQAFIKKHINTYTSHASIVQIIQDDVHPENNGKLLIWRYKKTIWDKLYNESHPQFGVNPQPFDIVNGRYFAVNVTLKSGYNNYDNCQFINAQTSGIYVNTPNGGFSQVDSSTDRQLIYDFLVNNSPDLSKYAPKEWDEKTAAFVNGALDAINRYAQLGSIPGNIAAVTNTNPLANNPVATNVPPTPQFSVPTPQFNTPTSNVLNVAPSFTPPTSDVPNVTPVTVTTPTPASITGIDLPPVVEVSNVPQPPVGLGLGLNDIVGNI